jgi:hypothetical protein
MSPISNHYTKARPLTIHGLKVYNQGDKTVINNDKAGCSVSYPKASVDLGKDKSLIIQRPTGTIEIEPDGEPGYLGVVPSKKETCVFEGGTIPERQYETKPQDRGF